jgi:fructokinase
MGEALFDCLPEGRKLGGAPANFAYHAGQFGLQSVAVSAIGDDALGHDIVAQLKEKNLPAVLEVVPFETGTVQVTLNAAGIPEYEIKEGVAWDNIPYTDALRRLAGETCAVCFGSLAQRNPVSRQTIKSFLDDMPDDDRVLKIFDINLRQHFYSREVLEESFCKCNILKINDEELQVLANMYSWNGISMKDQCWILLARYALKMLILTCGTDGSYVFTPGAVSFQPTPRVEVADTVGAGDSFTGAFVASIIKGRSVEEAHQRAVNVSAYVCTQNGAMPVLPDSLID